VSKKKEIVEFVASMAMLADDVGAVDPWISKAWKVSTALFAVTAGCPAGAVISDW
jgi:hypothetical protein